MNKIKTLAYQLRSAVNGCTRIGAQKRAERRENPELGKITIYSYRQRDALIDTGTMYARYCAGKCVKQVKDLTAELATAWLLEKAAEGARQETLDAYASRLGKIGDCCNAHFASCDINLHVKPPRAQYQEKLRTDAMTHEQYDRILQVMSPSSGRDAVELAGAFGLRVSETIKLRPKDWDKMNNTLTIYKSKGGRTRVLPVETEVQKELLERLTKGKGESERLCPILPGSVDRSLARAEERAGNCENLRRQKQGIHAIRKMVAQDMYDRLRAQGKSDKEACGDVTEYLGHGRDRADLIKTYILKRRA